VVDRRNEQKSLTGITYLSTVLGKYDIRGKNENKYSK
jgi:hypothetical protein